MPVQMSAYLKAVIRSLVFNERKGKVGAKRKQSPANSSKATNNSPKSQREYKGQN